MLPWELLLFSVSMKHSLKSLVGKHTRAFPFPRVGEWVAVYPVSGIFLSDVPRPGRDAGLPTHLIEDLLPHLTVCQLDELQPVLNHRGNTFTAPLCGLCLLHFSLFQGYQLCLDGLECSLTCVGLIT